jgi:poly(3-hydroxybutyrate) depolymerase
MFPDHPDDVGEAVGWLDRNAVAYGLDPDRIFLMGHSAGAHLASLVSTDPSYVRRHGVDPRQMTGTVTLDTGAFDVARAVGGGDSSEASLGVSVSRGKHSFAVRPLYPSGRPGEAKVVKFRAVARKQR